MALEQIVFNIAAFSDADGGGNNYIKDEVYEIYNINDTLATIYVDKTGDNEIAQDGVSNVSNASGEVIFYIAPGAYYIKIGGKFRDFNTSESEIITKMVTLSSGQTTVSFDDINATLSSFYVNESSGDRGRLFEGSDYFVVNTQTIELKRSFSAGSYCVAVYGGVGQSLTSTNALYAPYFGLVGDGETLNDVNIKTLVDTALNNKLAIDWGESGNIYLTSSSINDLHRVQHTGFGKIKRGTYIFNPVQVDEYETENEIFVSSTAVSGSDGLTPTEPMPYSEVRDCILNYGPYLHGKWIFKFASGNYEVNSSYGIRVGHDGDTGDYQQSENNILNANYVIFEGANVGYDPETNPAPVPLTVFDGLDNSTILFDFRGGFRAYLKDIKVKNANGSASSGGIACSGGGLRCENVHTSDNVYGISALSYCHLEIKGGIIEGDSSGGKSNTGIRSIFHTKHDIGNQQAGAAGQGPFIKNCNQGLFTQEFAAGHSDYVTYEDNAFAIRARVGSRVNPNGSDFKRNNVVARGDTNSVIGWNGNETFNIGTVNENLDIMQAVSGGRMTYVGGEASELISYPADWQTVIKAFSLGTSAGSTSPYTFRSSQFPSGFFSSLSSSTFSGKSLRFKIVGEVSGTADTKQLTLLLGEFGGTLNPISSINIPSATVGKFIFEGEINFISDGMQFMHYSFSSGNQSSQSSLDLSFDMNINSKYQLNLRSTLSNASDSITVNYYTVDVQGAL